MSSCKPSIKSESVSQMFDFNWKYCVGNIPDAYRVTYNDNAWQNIDMPHHWQSDSLIINTIGQCQNDSVPHASLWYRKQFTLPQLWAHKQISIQFDGISNIEGIFINGVNVSTSIKSAQNKKVDITPHLKFESKNVIALQMNLSSARTELISQKGIYSHLWLTITNQSDVRK